MKTLASSMGDIIIGDLSAGLEDRLTNLSPGGVMVLADENTARLCLPRLGEAFHAYPVSTIPAGEAFKTLESCQRVWAALVAHRIDRQGILVNVGGGMITDLGGFAAACYLRGIRFVHIPTSLLGMADAAIGGKTGVDFLGFKNYLGTFRGPAFTWIDPAFLQTLPEDEYSCGMAEIVKHAIIGSLPLWHRLNKPDWNPTQPWADILAENALVKAGIIDRDPEEKGLRKLLNFGHTIGHALESHFLAGPSALRHGQAVTLGMLAEGYIACRMGLLAQPDFDAIRQLIDRLLSPVRIGIPTFAVLAAWLRGDKKFQSGRLGFSLPDGIGRGIVDVAVSEFEINQSLMWLHDHLAGGDPQSPAGQN